MKELTKCLIRSASILLLVTLLWNFHGFSQVLQPVKWKFTTQKISDSVAEMVFTATVDPGWHLYSQKVVEDGPIPTSFKFSTKKGVKLLGPTTEPNIKPHFDKVFGAEIKYFDGQAIFRQKVLITSDQKPELKGSLEYMACDDTKCLAPVEEEFSFTFQGYKPSVKISPDEIPAEVELKDSVKTKAEVKPAQDSTAAKVEKALLMRILINLSGVSFFSFLFGLAAILTPCVFPMIPMTVTYFMKDKNKTKAKLEAIFFGISIILIYTIIGTIVAVTFGADFVNFVSTHWLPNVLFFLIFLVFAASFLGMFEITLPSWLINKSDAQVDKGGWLGPFFMAFTLVLVSFSCTGPIVGAILVVAAQGQIIEPIVGMLGFSLAFALPFSLFAFFPHWLQNLPKSGGWLNSVKVVLGFLELALGLKFLSIADQTYHWHILDREVYLAFWIVIFFLMGLYLLGKLKTAHDDEVQHVGVPRLLLAIITFTFVVYMIPGMWGAPLKVLSGYLPPETSQDFDINAVIRKNLQTYTPSGGSSSTSSSICDQPKYGDFLHLPHGLQGYFDYEQGLACAKKQNKPIFIDFTGHGCVNCREMEANVWSAPEVLKRLKNDFVIIALYVDDKTMLPEKEWYTSTYDHKVKDRIGKKYADLQVSRFNVNAQPYYVLLDTAGNLLVPPRGHDLNVDAYVKFLDAGKAAFAKRQTSPTSAK